MGSFSFDIASTYDKAEMNNVYAATQRDIAHRYDFKGTPASIEWLGDKTGFVITGSNDWQCESVLDIVRKHLAARGLTAKVLDLSKTPVTGNLKVTQEVPFKMGLSQDNAKEISKLLRDTHPKLKASIQGDTVRVTGSNKDELQAAQQTVSGHGFEFPIGYTNYR